MNQKQKDAWLEALRSGEYRQARGQLCSFYGYCCLGVYAAVHEPAWLDLNRDKGFLWRENFPNGEPFDQTVQAKLVDMNDAGHKSFPEIADWIEANIEATP